MHEQRSRLPNYYLGVQVHQNGSFTEVFNGPCAIASEAVKGRLPPKTNLHSVLISALNKLQTRVRPEDRIPLRIDKRSRGDRL